MKLGERTTLKNTGKVMYFFSFVFFYIFLFQTHLFSQNSDTKELDKILRTELGDSNGNSAQASEPKNNSENSKTPPNKANTDLKDNQEPTEVDPLKERYGEVNDDSPSATWVLLKILFVLCILVGAGYYLILQMQKTKSAKYPVKGFMKVLSHLPLSATQSVQMVEVGGKILVLGVADGSVTLISEVTSPDEKSQILKEKEEADPYVPNFLETLLESLQNKAPRKIRIDKNKMEMTESDFSFDLQNKAKEGLERLRKQREMLEGGGSV